MRVRRGLWTWLFVGLMASTGRAQPTETSSGLRVYAGEGLEVLCEEVVRVLRRRTGRDIQFAGAPPELAEAVTTGEVALVEREGAIFIAYGGAGGRTVTTHLSVPITRRSARTVALAVQSLADEATLEVPTEAAPPPPNSYVYLEYDDPVPERQGVAQPLVFLRLLAGYSLTQGRVLVGPGAGFGLCVKTSCVSMEADMPLVPERHVLSGQAVRMRIVNAALRAQFRPLVRGDFSGGVTVGLLTRVISATVLASDERATISDFGFRGSFEAAWRFSGPFELVAELGADYVFDTPRVLGLVRVGGFFPWITTSIRVRPLG